MWTKCCVVILFHRWTLNPLLSKSFSNRDCLRRSVRIFLDKSELHFFSNRSIFELFHWIHVYFMTHSVNNWLPASQKSENLMQISRKRVNQRRQKKWNISENHKSNSFFCRMALGNESWKWKGRKVQRDPFFERV